MCGWWWCWCQMKNTIVHSFLLETFNSIIFIFWWYRRCFLWRCFLTLFGHFQLLTIFFAASFEYCWHKNDLIVNLLHSRNVWLESVRKWKGNCLDNGHPIKCQCSIRIKYFTKTLSNFEIQLNFFYGKSIAQTNPCLIQHLIYLHTLFKMIFHFVISFLFQFFYTQKFFDRNSNGWVVRKLCRCDNTSNQFVIIWMYVSQQKLRPLYFRNYAMYEEGNRLRMNVTAQFLLHSWTVLLAASNSFARSPIIFAWTTNISK